MSFREAFRAAFSLPWPIDPRLIYLNTANQSFTPDAVLGALPRYAREYERNPTSGLAGAWGRLWEVQEELARFLDARPADLFLRPNVTSVLNAFLLGVPIAEGGEILVGELEYGAIVNVCRLRAQRDRLRLRVLKLPLGPVALRQLSRGELVDRVLSQLGPDTRLLLLSHVLGGVGLVMPIEEVAAETRRRGITLVVDGAYAPGARPVALTQLEDIDFYGCSLYKWMLGPKGTAFGWVHPRQQERLVPIHAGWSTFETFPPFRAFGGGSRFQSTFLMTGCHDFSPFFAIRDLLARWSEWGPERVWARLVVLRESLANAVDRRLGWVPGSAAAPELQGGLSAFLLPARLQPEGARITRRLLEEHAVQINAIEWRGQWYAVFSPHAYNTEEEIEAAVLRLARL